MHVGDRDYIMWNQLKRRLGEGYRKEEAYWAQKSRIHWLKEGDQNTKFFFHAFTIQRKKKNCIEKLVNDQEEVCNSQE